MRKNAFTDVQVSTTKLSLQAVPSSGGAVSQVFNLTGMRKPLFEIFVGAQASGDTLSTTNKYTIKAEKATASGGSYSACTSSEFDSATAINSSGEFIVIDAAGDADKIYSASYYGINDYVKITITPGGTLNTGCTFGISVTDVEPISLPKSNT